LPQPLQYQVVISPRALDEIEEICAYYEPIAPDYASALYKKLITRIRSLRQLPYAFRVYQPRKAPDLTVHAMSVNPYVVYYRVSENGRRINILRVLHGARRQPRRFQ
jgi:plasmid stabilization system protein ParE